MALRVICGPKGSGKTVLTTRFLYYDWKKGRSIRANYGLRFPFGTIDLEEMLQHNEELRDLSLGVDEAQLYFDCRLSGTKKNRLFSYIMLQTRKRRMDMYLTTQQLGNVDVRIRNNLDYLYQCSALIKRRGKYYFASAEDCDQQRIDGIFVIEYNFAQGITKKFAFNPKPWFKFFDTEEFMVIGNGED